jgi:hypothetical protein
MLIALLLPAIQAARESARKMQCQNKLKQLALASNTYHETYGTLPAGQCRNLSKYKGTMWARFSGKMLFLPFFEQAALYELWKNSTVDPSGLPAVTSSDMNDPRNHSVEIFLCPSDPYRMDSVTKVKANYGFFYGDSPWNHYQGYTSAYSTIPWQRGAFGWATAVDNDVNGGNPALAGYSFEAFTDGTSNTLLMSERVVGSTDSWSSWMLLDGVYMNNSLGGISGSRPNNYFSDRSKCTEWVDPANPGQYKAQGAAGFGLKYWDAMLSGLFTVIPPNGPSCHSRKDGELGIVTPTSMHTGGVQCSRADGSVTFINKGIDAGPALNTVISAATTADAPSPFGVWGALGSRCGGESKSP